MRATHTPGPWKAVDYMARAELIEGPNGQDLAMRQDGAKVADMLLMAAAPELLAELEKAHGIIRNALAVMTTEQKAEWGRLNAPADLEGEGVTRANERAAAIAKAGGCSMSQPKKVSHKAAKAAGLKVYYTAKPCKNGNVALRRTSDRACLCEVCAGERRVRLLGVYHANKAKAKPGQPTENAQGAE